MHCIAAGNVLLLRNVLHLNPDITEVSQQKLLSLIAERLIGSNSNVNVRSDMLQSFFLKKNKIMIVGNG